MDVSNAGMDDAWPCTMAHCKEYARRIGSYLPLCALAATSYYVDEVAAEQAVPGAANARERHAKAESGFSSYCGHGATDTPHAARFEDVVLYEQTRRSRCAAMDSQAYSSGRYRGVCYATT